VNNDKKNMLKAFLFLLLTFFLLSCVSNNNVNAVNTGFFKVDGTKILDADDNEFFIKGVNVNGPGWCFPRDTLQDVKLIVDVWQFNTVRLCAATKWNSWAVNYNRNLDAIVKRFTDNGIVVILELHDYTGIYPPLNDNGGYITKEGDIIRPIKDLKLWWIDKAKRFKDNQYVWFNIMNEPGDAGTKESAESWMYVHEEVIKAIRNEGAENIIVIDDHIWGQAGGYYGGINSYDSAVMRKGQELNKKYNNLIYSLHVYEAWSDGKNRFDAYFRDAKSLGLCVIIGEFGVMRNNIAQYSAVKSMFDSAIPNKIGRIYWAWDDGGLPMTTGENGRGWAIDKKDGSKPSNLSWAGDLVWQDNRGLLKTPVPQFDLNLPLVLNSGFEEGMSGWQDWGRASVQKNVSYNKSAALVISSGGQGGAGQPLRLTPDTVYHLSVWGRGNCDIGVKYRLNENDPNEHHNTITFSEDKWTEKSITFTTPAKFFGPIFFIWKNNANVTFYLDDVKLTGE